MTGDSIRYLREKCDLTVQGLWQKQSPSTQLDKVLCSLLPVFPLQTVLVNPSIHSLHSGKSLPIEWNGYTNEILLQLQDRLGFTRGH